MNHSNNNNKEKKQYKQQTMFNFFPTTNNSLSGNRPNNRNDRTNFSSQNPTQINSQKKKKKKKKKINPQQQPYLSNNTSSFFSPQKESQKKKPKKKKKVNERQSQTFFTPKESRKRKRVDNTPNGSIPFDYDSNESDDGIYREAQAKRRKLMKKTQPRNRKKPKIDFSFKDPNNPDRMDVNHNKIESVDYDPSTVFVPLQSINEMTKFEAQYWKLKSQHMDKILFFKKGKFYEMYHEDADIGKRDFDLKMTFNRNDRMCGIPEAKKDKWIRYFLTKGHKLVIVDEIVQEDEDPTKLKDRVITSVLTPGTITDSNLIPSNSSSYLFSVVESVTRTGGPVYGICVVDCSHQLIILAHLVDDSQRTKFQTIIREYNPSEVLFKVSSLSRTTAQIISNLNIPRENKVKGKDEVFKNFKEDLFDEYIDIRNFLSEKEKNRTNIEGQPKNVFDCFLDYGDNPEVMESVGGALLYLRKLGNKERVLLKYNNCVVYSTFRSKLMKIDGQALKNLEIFNNSFDGSMKGTLLNFLKRCQTKYGQAELRQWIRHPLLQKDQILERHKAINDLAQENGWIVTEFDNATKKRVDIPSHLSFLFAVANRDQRVSTHDNTFRNKYIKKFVDMFDALKSLNHFARRLVKKVRKNEISITSKVLLQIMEEFRDINDILKKFEPDRDRLNVAQSKNERVYFDPNENEEYDEIMNRKNELDETIEKYKINFKKELECKGVDFDINTKKSEIEVFLLIPTRAKIKPDKLEYRKKGNVKKGNQAYQHRKTEKIAKGLTKIRSERRKFEDSIIKSLCKDLLSDDRKMQFIKMINQFKVLDCLVCFRKTINCCNSEDYPLVEPKIIEGEYKRPVIKLEGSYHPCIQSELSSLGKPFIKNNFQIGGADPSCIILTGPNMGGKSTMLRTVCVCTILAQIGMYVPAKKMEFTLVDRIFTRIGANDQICSGESTFMVEMNETSSILSSATPRSLVILDELGRGTSTNDGYAIAYATITYIVEKVKSLTIFATHMHNLAKDLKYYPFVSFYKMGYHLIPQEESIGLDNKVITCSDERIIFKYNIEKGVCDKSFGIHVARLAGINKEICDRGQNISNKVRSASKNPEIDLKLTEDYYKALAKISTVMLKNGPKNNSEMKDIFNFCHEKFGIYSNENLQVLQNNNEDSDNDFDEDIDMDKIKINVDDDIDMDKEKMDERDDF